MKNTLLISTLLVLLCSGCKQQFDGKGLKEGRVMGKFIAIDSTHSIKGGVLSIQSTDIRDGVVDTVYTLINDEEAKSAYSLLQNAKPENVWCELTFDKAYARTKFSAPTEHTNWITLSKGHVCYDIKAKFTIKERENIN